MQPADWQALIDNDYAPTDGSAALDLTIALVDLMCAADAGERWLGRHIFTTWLARGVYSDDALRGLLMLLVMRLSAGLGEVEADGVVARAAALRGLAYILRYEAKARFLSANEAHNLLRWLLDYLDSERDWRDDVPGLGTADAARPLAAVLARLAAHPHLTADDLAPLRARLAGDAEPGQTLRALLASDPDLPA